MQAAQVWAHKTGESAGLLCMLYEPLHVSVGAAQALQIGILSKRLRGIFIHACCLDEQHASGSHQAAIHRGVRRLHTASWQL